ncbi:acyl-phosphate glycerol-3-phosphate acyltransferase [Granulicatella balaenopterae]|uniref:Glycerol-3-phosphate acyltransferase n=2 Tax=Granulicatella balaenopterae TaxID=137733 RepID=A0A1H9K6B0_9LACT|nr:acyl-phosphate glycerol-3-phosphate acyltransferase [Granulicatella balaenopterae]
MNLIISCMIAYILGSIPSGVWVGKYFYKKDIREYGSGNMGTTNTFRVLGKKAGILVLCMDILKGYIPMIVAQHVLHVTPSLVLYTGLFAILGHVYPVFANFRGGKAVATITGVMLAYQPALTLCCMLAFLITLLLSRMVSLSSIISVLVGVAISFTTNDLTLKIVALIAASFIIIRHRTNIKRIMDGTENKVRFSWNKE